MQQGYQQTSYTNPPQRQGGWGFYSGERVVELRIHGKAVAGHGSRGALWLENYGGKEVQWRIKHLWDNVIELRSHDHHYLGCDYSGRAYLHHSHHDGGDTRFYMEHVGSNLVCFRSTHGPYLSIYDNGNFYVASDRGGNNTFEEYVMY